MSMSGISSKAPSWFWNWASNVEAIDLSDNHIEGDLSNILLNSTVINLRSNHFKGRFPLLSENVKVLNIANNSYSGPISTFLCQKAIRKNKLVVLDASDNLLLGELSHCWRYWQQGSRYRTESALVSERHHYLAKRRWHWFMLFKRPKRIISKRYFLDLISSWMYPKHT
nr:hypothetical protein CFP56_40614 [Quercus suber]